MAERATLGRWPAWAWFVLAGAVVAVLSRLAPDPWPDVGYALFGPAAALAIVAGVRLHRPPRPLPWYLLAAGQGLWGVADAVGSAYSALVDDEAFPNPSDPVYLAGYAVTAAGLARLVAGRSARRDATGNLDAAILTSALGLLSWVVLARPTAEVFRDSPAAAAVGVAYPMVDIVLVALLLRLQTAAGRRSRSFWFLVHGLVLLIVADTLASAAKLLTWESSDQLDLIWLCSYLAIGAAGLHPSMRSVSETSRDDGPRYLSTGRFLALLAAVLVAPAILLVQALGGGSVDAWAIGVGSAITSALVMARIMLSVRRMERLHSERERARAELAHQAAHDSLTGLPNRAQAMDLLRAALNRARRTGALVGVLFIDLDGFKKVNDTLGHAAGDEVLAAAGSRMQRCVRGGDVVARLGGDEFVVLLETLDDEANAVQVAKRLVAEIAEPIALSTGREARIGASIGLAVNSDSGVDAERLLHEADEAVFRAKAAGRGRVEVFAPSLRAELQRRSENTAVIGRALREGSAILLGEPIVELATGRQVGVQAEVSVPASDEEFLTRPQLLADAEGTDQLCDLDSWVLRNLAARLPAAGPEWLVMVPVTWRHLASGLLLDDLAAAAEQGVRAEQVMLLVPAEEVVGDPRALGVLEQARRLGVRVCADSFGAGDSGTDRWANLPMDYVRLDRRLMSPSVGQLLLQLTVETANAFGYAVLAPGVADADEADRVAAAGCDLGVGPWYADLALTTGSPVPGSR